MYDLEGNYIYFDDESSQRNNLVTIHFEITSQIRRTVVINENKKIEELIKFYFKTLNQPELFGDPCIRFICNAKFLKHNSKYLVKSLKRKYKYIYIIVNDFEEKIKEFN